MAVIRKNKQTNKQQLKYVYLHTMSEIFPHAYHTILSQVLARPKLGPDKSELSLETKLTQIL